MPLIKVICKFSGMSSKLWPLVRDFGLFKAFKRFSNFIRLHFENSIQYFAIFICMYLYYVCWKKKSSPNIYRNHHILRKSFPH